MIAVENQVVIQPVSVAAIFDAPNSSDLFQANAAECLVPGAQPQREVYEAMERAGILHCFGAYTYVDSFEMYAINGYPSLLIGFGSVICGVMPHIGKSLATVESLFVDPAYRSTEAGNRLLDAIEQCAVDAGCVAVTSAARVGSAFDKVLSRRSGYTLTHSQHTRWLA
jgi:GNAT superfamily N-acetyltransferase